MDQMKEERKELFLDYKVMDEDETKLRDLSLEAADYVRTGLLVRLIYVS